MPEPSKIFKSKKIYKISSNMIKTCHQRWFLVLLLLSIGILETKHKCTSLLSAYLAWIFHYFCVMVFVLLLAIKKESRLILGNFRMIYLIFV